MALDKQKINDFLINRWNHLVDKEKGMTGVRGFEQVELIRIDGILNFIIEISNKIEKGDFNDRT